MQRIFAKLVPRSAIARLIVGSIVVGLLTFPLILTALTSTEINLVFAGVVTLACIFGVGIRPKLRYILAFVASSAVTFPPFPLWLKSNGAGGIILEWSQEVVSRAPVFHVVFFIWNFLLVLFLFYVCIVPLHRNEGRASASTETR